MAILFSIAFLIFAFWIGYELYNAPLIEDQQKKDHEECIEARQMKTDMNVSVDNL